MIVELAIITALGLGLRKKVSAVNNLEYELQGIKIDKKKSNIRQITLNVKIGIINKVNTTLTFDSFDGYVYYNGRLGATFSIKGKTKITIKPSTTTSITFPIVIKNMNMVGILVSAITNFIKDKSDLGEVTLKGKLNIGVITIPVNESYPLSAPQE